MTAANSVPGFLTSSVKYLEFMQQRYGLIVSHESNRPVTCNLAFCMPHVKQIERWGVLSAVYQGRHSDTLAGAPTEAISLIELRQGWIGRDESRETLP